MSMSDILADCLKIELTNRRNATHFIMCNGEKIRFIVDLFGGKARLSQNIKSYSKKLSFVMKLMNILPLQLLHLGKLGYFAKVTPCEAVQRNLLKTKMNKWNVIVGTYDEKQKLVFQCFAHGQKAQYVKVGNKNTENEMQNEISFLKENHDKSIFVVPELIGYEVQSEACPLTIQITGHFSGKKVKPVLTKDIIRIYQDICSKDPMFSHGDFAPWNIRKDGDKYIVFDWENCGQRIIGFDLMHFAVVSQVILSGMKEHDAFVVGISEIRRYIPDFELDENEFFSEFHKLRLGV